MSTNESFKDKFLGHISRNRGKYAAAGGVGATLGGINLAGNGYLGTNAQDAVHDLAYPISNNLKTVALYNGAKTNVTPYLNVYSKPDNIIDGNNNDLLLQSEKVLQKANVPTVGGYVGSKVTDAISGLTPTEKFNYALRHPINAAEMKWDQSSASTSGAIDSVSDFLHK